MPSQPSSQSNTVRSISIGYLLIEDQITPGDSAIIQWLSSQADFKLHQILIQDINSVDDLKICQVIWIHIPDPASYDNWKEYIENLRYLKRCFENGGNLLLTHYAAYLSHDLGIESNRPGESAIDISNQGYGRKHGFQSFRGHPILKSFFGGGYTWDGERDHRETRIGFFDNRWSQEGMVAAVDKSYITVNPDNRLIIEYHSPKGKTLAIGGYVHFEQKNHLRQHLEQFMHDVIHYLAAAGEQNQASYWLTDDLKPKAFSVSSQPLIVGKNRLLTGREQSGLLLAREPATENYIETAGLRCLMMGKETGEIDEVWVHPFRVLRDLQIGVIENKTVTWLKDLAAKVEIRPESVSQIYHTKWGEIIQIVFAAQGHPGGVIHLASAGSRPVSLAVKFRCDLRWMWPYRENALGSLHYAYDKELNALHVKDRSADFYCLIGGDKKPVAQLQGQFAEIEFKSGQFHGVETTENQVCQAFRFELNPQNNYALNIIIAATDQGRGEAENTYRELMKEPLQIYNQAVNHYQNLLSTRTIITSPDPVFNEGYQWALVATDRFFVRTPNLGSALMAGFGATARGWDGGQRISGRPGYGWYFGRDAEWAGFALNACGAFEQVKAQLQFLAQFQDISGKIFHELTSSGAIHYDAADATPLYLALAANYLKASGDVEFIKSLWPSLKKAMDFMYATDTDDDGLIENTNVGHGWIEGGKLYGAHVTLYLAGCWAKALQSASFIAGEMGEDSLSGQYRKDAEKVGEIIHRDFWNEETRFFNYGKRINGSFEQSKTVLPAVPMFFNLLEDRKTGSMLDTWAGNSFSTDWGIRILSSESPYFNPTGYHYGSVWPLFTGWAALAEYQYGRPVQGFTRIMNNLLIYQNWSPGYVEEVMHGTEYKPAGVCPHQCWSETNVLHPALNGMIGLDPDAPGNRLILRPRFPVHWDHAEVKNICIGDSRLDMFYRRENGSAAFRFTKQEGRPLKIELQPELAEAMEITAINVNDEMQPLRQRGARGLLANPISFSLQEETVVEIRYRGGIGMIPYIAEPQPGDSSQGYRIIHTELRENQYHITVEGKDNSRGVFLVNTLGTEIVKSEGAEIVSTGDEGIFKLNVNFGADSSPYVSKEIILYLR